MRQKQKINPVFVIGQFLSNLEIYRAVNACEFIHIIYLLFFQNSSFLHVINLEQLPKNRWKNNTSFLVILVCFKLPRNVSVALCFNVPLTVIKMM
jgi:hypothetical protein